MIEIYGGVQPALWTDPMCIACRGTGVTGPFGSRIFRPLVEGGGEREWWEPCRSCSIRPTTNEHAHEPGTGMTIYLQETVRRGPTYGPGLRTTVREIVIWADAGGFAWIRSGDAPSAITRADWSARPAGETLVAIYPGAEILDVEHGPDDPRAVTMYETTLTATHDDDVD